MIALERPLVFFDLEATGVSPEKDRIVDIALVKRHPDGREEVFSALVNPGMPIPREAVAVHHIDDGMVAGAPRFSEVAPRVLEFIGDADLGGFNIMRFDVPLLQAELARCGHALALEGRRLVDSQVIYHRMERRTLSAAYQFYCGKPLADAHRAEPDARASLEVFFGQLTRYPELPATMEGVAAFCSAKDPGKVDAEGKLVWRNGEAAFNFGKYRTLTLREVVAKERGYVEWLKRAERTTPELARICEEALSGRFPQPKASA
ncbi:MAG: 3'-5' exonuclease [Elusimicrobia bacterium]|nr:3'-5' exonuclease [Elusimicrobiota bacterium]MDE2424314.1 3'-5' exonuclease [Elusimicrobiota bacterium]